MSVVNRTATEPLVKKTEEIDENKAGFVLGTALKPLQQLTENNLNTSSSPVQ